MIDTITRFLNNVRDGSVREALRAILNPISDRFSTQPISTFGLVIKTGGSALVKTGASAAYAMVQGKLVKVAGSTDQAALSGTVTNAKFNVYAYFLDGAGTGTSAMGVEGATLAAVQFPPIPQGKACIGFTIINPTGTGNFVGGTTPIDDATVVPNAVHISLLVPVDPTVLIGY